MADASNRKVPLPAFLKMLTDNNIPPSKAMAVAGKMLATIHSFHEVLTCSQTIRYKTCNTPALLGELSQFSLESAGVDEKDLRKLVLAAVRKAGYKHKSASGSGGSRNVPSTSKAGSKADTKPPQKKRKRDDDLNELLPEGPSEEGDSYGSLQFNENLDEEAIRTKSTVINRAPIMMAWAFVVAERMGFQREEALSIASVYTEMNAISKGVSLGLYKDGKQDGREASRTGSQPYVELMGRRPLYQTANSQWRALSAGAPVPPTSAFSYITRALRQTAPNIVGALRLLAESFPPKELNEKGFSLYADFRPQSEGWGQRGEVRCSTILGLRKVSGESAEKDGLATSLMDAPSAVDNIVQLKPPPGESGEAAHASEDPPFKKPRRESFELDEYDAALDDDALFGEFDLSSIL
ncbi:hypothetical protein GSI_00811 [Ganoderma sinense ZZ0214-1]|uniref:Uncharacterized protein n=1 Tax=Ganoderma sinense ZZ0214-1 TaxID=1077348 RepID=A0A2G8STL4_9APHY|nr:hypothetical protein GSI_00811 [Ganoderma sinense ZZ0214-1]